MTDRKTLDQHALGEDIQPEDAVRYFGREIQEILTPPLTLVGITFIIQDADGTQMDYTLKHKKFHNPEGDQEVEEDEAIFAEDCAEEELELSEEGQA